MFDHKYRPRKNSKEVTPKQTPKIWWDYIQENMQFKALKSPNERMIERDKKALTKFKNQMLDLGLTLDQKKEFDKDISPDDRDSVKSDCHKNNKMADDFINKIIKEKQKVKMEQVRESRKLNLQRLVE